MHLPVGSEVPDIGISPSSILQEDESLISTPPCAISNHGVGVRNRSKRTWVNRKAAYINSLERRNPIQSPLVWACSYKRVSKSQKRKYGEIKHHLRPSLSLFVESHGVTRLLKLKCDPATGVCLGLAWAAR